MVLDCDLGRGGLLLLLLGIVAAPALAGESVDGDERTVPALVAKLGNDSYRVRERACDLLYIEGTDAKPALEMAARSADPQVRRLARRLLFLIRWQLPPDLYRKIGPLWDDFDSLPVRGRLRLVRRIAGIVDEVAVRLLRRVSEIDPHAAVRDLARRSLAGLFITSLNGEGCRYMEKGKYDEAEEKFKEMLRLDPGNPIALYNLACSRSLQADIDGALDYLRQSLRNGYRDFAWAREDKDLANLREDPRFEELLRGAWKD